MKVAKTVVLMGLCCAAALTASAGKSLKEALRANAEQMAMSMLPTNAVNEAAGFFVPVTKKYLPTFERFCGEYRASKDKLAVVEKYLPKAKAAYGEAKAMKVPAKYVAKKDEYLRMFNEFIAAVDVAVAAFESNRKEGAGDEN